MASGLELRCVSNRRCNKLYSPTHDRPPCLFYSSQICMAPTVLIFVNIPRVFLKYSEQLAECQLILLDANNTNMKRKIEVEGGS
jgi:hypothetical protein